MIELLIVVVIIGILAGVALPNYQQFMIDQRRADAHHLLLFNSSKLTKCLTLAGSYLNNCKLMEESKEGHYSLTSQLTANTWTLTAVPVPDKPQANDGDCQSLTLDHIGVKTSTGDNSSSCWN